MAIRFSPEADLLIACARTSLDPANEARIIELIQEDIDWGKLTSLACVHGMRALLYWHLNAIHPVGIPPEFIADLREHYQNNAVRNLLHVREMGKLLAAFESHQIPIIPYKGPVLAELAYGNLSLRHFADLDLLIAKQDFHHARELFTSLGYASWIPLTPNQEAACLKFDHEFGLGLVSQDGKVALDLHWGAVPRELDLSEFEAQLWDRSTRMAFAGTETSVLSLVDHILVLCLHGSKPVHGWERLSWICDVAELLRNLQESDWQSLADQAAAMRVERMIYLGFYLAHDLLGADLPPDILQHIQSDPAIASLGNQIYARIFGEDETHIGILESALFYLRASTLLGEGLRHTMRRIFTPTLEDWGKISLPVPLYYFYRPWRLIKKHTRKKGE